MKVHIKFLNHGKGSAALASSYVLDELDHKGQVRAGVEVLRGDATTFNSICNSSPHLWKYTSGVIAWSKDDNPTPEQIQEVLAEFEKHAFSGLDPSQYHLFAVQHTDDDGSKHIHILVPRLDLESGKHLNIAPPGHESYFDPLRDYFNTKYQWSRPDDLSWSNTTQEPNHVAKINKNAEKIIPKQDLEKMKRKQFCRYADMHIHKMLKAGEIENRADIVAEIECFKGVQSIKPSKEFLTVILDNGIKHRLRGDFYFENFEIGAYTQRLREAAASRATPDELRSAIREADNLVAASRAKRATYNQKHYPLTQGRDYDNSHRIAFKLDFYQHRELITPSPQSNNRELYGATRDLPRDTPTDSIEYRFIETQTTFSLDAFLTNGNRQRNRQYFNQSRELTSISPSPSRAGDSGPTGAIAAQDSLSNYGKFEYSTKDLRHLGESSFWNVDVFNRFISQLSVQYVPKDNRQSKPSNSQLSAHDAAAGEIIDADRNRQDSSGTEQFIDATEQLVSRTEQLVSTAKQLFVSANQFLKSHREHLQRLNRDSENIDHRAENANFQAETGRIFRGIVKGLSEKLASPIGNAVHYSLEQSELGKYCHRISGEKSRSIAVEARADACESRLLQRYRDAERASSFACEHHRIFKSFNQDLDQLTQDFADFRPKPKPATDFSNLRTDGYYPGYIASHKELSAQQEQAYQSKNVISLIKFTEQKAKNLNQYMKQARKMLYSHDYQRLEEIIKNDKKMLRHLECEVILAPQNSHLKEQRASYHACLETFGEITENVQAILTPPHQSQVKEQSSQPKPSRESNLDLNFH